MVFIRETTWQAAQSATRPDELQQLQEAIYQQVMLLLPDNVSTSQYFYSRINQQPLLHLHILEQHPYTSFLRLTHELHTDEQKASEPEAHIRMYHDLRIAEVTAFDLRRGINRLAGPDLDPTALQRIHWRQNRALHKWLDYLLQQGHSLASMRHRAEAFMPERLADQSAADIQPVSS